MAIGEAWHSYHVTKTGSTWASKGRLPGSHQGLVYCLTPEVLIFRGMPTEPKAFL